MSIKKGLSLICVTLIVAATPMRTAVVVGQTASAGTKVDGLRVPAGTTLLSPALVEAEAVPAVVHLSNGHVLAFDQETSALVTSTGNDLQVDIRAGSVAYSDENGEVTVLAANNVLTMTQEGEVEESAQVDAGEERLCQLQNWSQAKWQKCTVDEPKSNDCDWKLLEVPMSTVPQYLNINSYLSCKDRNPLGLNCDCGIKVIPWWLVGAGAAAAAGLIIIIDEDDPDPASPSTP